MIAIKMASNYIRGKIYSEVRKHEAKPLLNQWLGTFIGLTKRMVTNFYFKWHIPRFTLRARQICHNINWQIYAKLTNKSLFHFIGDSHAMNRGLGNQSIGHVMSSATAHNLIKEKSRVNSRQRLIKIINRINKERDVIIMIFGEVDCRIHFATQPEKGTPLDEAIKNTVMRYLSVVKVITESGYYILVSAIVPASKLNNPLDFPSNATPHRRSQITKLFNIQLKSQCQRLGIGYLDAYTPFADSEGFIKDKYTDDKVHLNQSANFCIINIIKEGIIDDTENSNYAREIRI